MRHLRYIFFIVAFAITFANSVAKGAMSLPELKQKCEEARSLSQYETLDAVSQQLLTMARAKGDVRMESYAYFYNGLAKLFLGDTASATAMLNAADESLERVPNDTVKALVFNVRGISQALIENNNFVAQTFFFKSLELAKKINYEELQLRVQGNLLTLSRSMNDSIAFRNAAEVYDYGVKHNSHEQIYMGAYYLATFYYNQKNYAQAEKYLLATIEMYKKRQYDDIASVYALYAKMLLNKGDVTLAEEKAQQALTFAEQYSQPSMEVEAYITLAEVMSEKKLYAKAIDMIKRAMDIADEIGMTNKAADCNRIMANNYLAMGNTAEALKCLQMANKLLEEKGEVNMERISHELKIMQEIENKDMEDKIKREKITFQNHLLVALGAAVLFLLLLLVVVIVNYRNRQILYKKIVLQNSRAVAQQKILQEQIDELTQKAQAADQEEQNTAVSSEESVADHAQTSIVDAKKDALYKHLCWLMDHERLYTESQLTRERMAERLSTNRTYLTQVIKEQTGMNYLQFINSYRINEAIRILSDPDKSDYPLKKIWSDLGFSSPSTFYKLFQQEVGITPSTYRKQFLEVCS